MNQRPQLSEHHEYYSVYIDRIPDGDIVDTLESQFQETLSLLRAVPPSREGYRYAPDKWSIREAVAHLVDCERVFGIRALHIARRDPAPLPSFDQDEWAAASEADGRSLQDLLDEWEAVRRSHVVMFRSFHDDWWDRRGVASEREFSVRSFPWIMAGHELHHRTLLQERYGVGGESS